MSYENSISNKRKMYIIPRGCKDVKEAISIHPEGDVAIRVAVYFNHEKYQVITDQTLEERGITIQKYIEDTESWRK